MSSQKLLIFKKQSEEGTLEEDGVGAGPDFSDKAFAVGGGPDFLDEEDGVGAGPDFSDKAFAVGGGLRLSSPELSFSELKQETLVRQKIKRKILMI